MKYNKYYFINKYIIKIYKIIIIKILMKIYYTKIKLKGCKYIVNKLYKNNNINNI